MINKKYKDKQQSLSLHAHIFKIEKPIQATISSNLTIMGSQFLSIYRTKEMVEESFCLTWLKVSLLLT